MHAVGFGGNCHVQTIIQYHSSFSLSTGESKRFVREGKQAASGQILLANLHPIHPGGDGAGDAAFQGSVLELVAVGNVVELEMRRHIKRVVGRRW